MYERGIVVVAITRQGIQTALKIQKGLNAAGLNTTIYAPKKYIQPGIVAINTNFAHFIQETYYKVDAIVAVMALGITIRCVAPLLESKLTDPAVIGVDVMGQFSISLLSGHLGGANDLANTIAQSINALPVITTATDVLGKQSVEGLARNLHLSIQNPSSLVALNAAIVNQDRLAVVLIGEHKIPPDALCAFEVQTAQNITQAIEIIDGYDAGIIITNDPLNSTHCTKPIIILKTRLIVVGLGARKESPASSIIAAVTSALEKTRVPLARVYCFATVDIKRNSQPMLDAVKALGAPLEFLSVDALRSVTYEDLSPDSAMVQEKIGVGGVCERAALLIAGNNSKLILKKTKQNGVTVAIAEGV